MVFLFLKEEKLGADKWRKECDALSYAMPNIRWRV